MRKCLICAVLIILGLAAVARITKGADMSGGTTGYPGATDTWTSQTTNDDTAPAKINGPALAIKAVQEELGTDPAQGKATVKAFLQAEHTSNGLHSDLANTDINTLTAATATITTTTITTANITNFQIGGVTVTPTAAELNVLDGNFIATATWNPASLAAAAEDSRVFTATGAALGDFCTGSFSLDVNDLMLDCNVTAANFVTCEFTNITTGTRDLASGTIRALIIPQ